MNEELVKLFERVPVIALDSEIRKIQFWSRYSNDSILYIFQVRQDVSTLSRVKDDDIITSVRAYDRSSARPTFITNERAALVNQSEKNS